MGNVGRDGGRKTLFMYVWVYVCECVCNKEEEKDIVGVQIGVSTELLMRHVWGEGVTHSSKR